jgi:hypothetical protein
MNFLILGSGFGLYGYLPVILKNPKNKLYLSSKYKKFFNSRKDIKRFRNNIFWYKKIYKVLNKVHKVIIAKRPSDQNKICKSLILGKKTIFLEKPLANNPDISLQLINFLIKKRINFNVAYLFNYTKWSSIFKKRLKKSYFKEFNFVWRFKSKIPSDNWKLNHKEGGGIINFYGIHLISLLADLNYFTLRSIIFKNHSDKLWLATFYRTGYAKINILLDIDSKKEEFFIEEINLNKKKNIIFIQNPLSEKKKFLFKKNDQHIDYRFKILTKYLYSKKKKISFHKNVIFLWKNIIKKTKIYNYN